MTIIKTKRYQIYIFSIIILLISTFNVKAQLVVDQSLTPEQLVQQILVGTGVSVSNVTYQGDPVIGIGSFSNGDNTNLGIDEGVILTSGDITNIPGECTTSVGGGFHNPNIGDWDLAV